MTVFGSARYPESHPYYAVARRLGAALVRLGFTVMTGGGPGYGILAALPYLLDRMATAGTIGARDRDLMLATDDLDEAVHHIRIHAVERFGLRRVYRPSALLGERRAVTF